MLTQIKFCSVCFVTLGYIAFNLARRAYRRYKYGDQLEQMKQDMNSPNASPFDTPFAAMFQKMVFSSMPNIAAIQQQHQAVTKSVYQQCQPVVQNNSKIQELLGGSIQCQEETASLNLGVVAQAFTTIQQLQQSRTTVQGQLSFQIVGSQRSGVITITFHKTLPPGVRGLGGQNSIENIEFKQSTLAIDGSTQLIDLTPYMNSAYTSSSSSSPIIDPTTNKPVQEAEFEEIKKQ